jgi:peroxiredoxin
VVSDEEVSQQRRMIDRILGETVAAPDFRMLRDTGHAVIDRYGIFNPESSESRPVPHPTTLVIDREGVVRWRVTETDYQLRPEPEQVIAALRWARGEGPDPGEPVLTNVRERNAGR